MRFCTSSAHTLASCGNASLHLFCGSDFHEWAPQAPCIFHRCCTHRRFLMDRICMSRVLCSLILIFCLHFHCSLFLKRNYFSYISRLFFGGTGAVHRESTEWIDFHKIFQVAMLLTKLLKVLWENDWICGKSWLRGGRKVLDSRVQYFFSLLWKRGKAHTVTN